MKNRIIAILLLVMLSVSILSSCGGAGNGSTEGGATGGEAGGGAEEVSPSNKHEGYLFSEELGVVPALIVSVAERISSEYTDVPRQAILRETGIHVPTYADTSKENLHEIVLGKTTRPISEKAYRLLNRMKTNSDYDVRWLVYSDGNSIAVAYDDDTLSLPLSLALDYLKEHFIHDKGEMKLSRGILASDCVSALEHYRDVDESAREVAWSRLEERIGEQGEEFVAAMKSLYSIYDSKVVTWLANLYDPAVGGFYYSNSGRNSEGFLPDLESTGQALGFISSSGMSRLVGGGYKNAIPEEMQKQLIAFAKKLQDPNGFFYHPQWSKELTDTKISRRARDMGSAVGILRNLGSSPTYTTPTGVAGDGILWDGTPVNSSSFVNPISTSTAQAVSKVVLTASYAEHLENEQTFREYLEHTKATKSSFYGIGNQITSEMAQIKARDVQLQTEGADYSLVDITIEWFNAHQDPETGLWGKEAIAPANYLGVNGLLKISGIYNAAEVEIPYAEKAAKAAIDAITSEEEMGAVVDLYNTWYAVGNVIDNVYQFGESKEVDGEMLSSFERAAAIQESLFGIAIPAIHISKEKIHQFQKPDGSFSYGRKYSSSTSQGMPVAVVNSAEGDVNATVIAINGIIGHIYDSLGISGYRVPLFGEAERRIFVNILENQGPVLKYNAEIVVDDPVDFESDEVGTEPVFIDTNISSTGSATVANNPSGTGKVLKFDTNAGAGDSVTVNNNVYSMIATQFVFEGDFYIEKATSKSSYAVQIFISQSYMIGFDINVEKGVVDICEHSAATWKTNISRRLATVPLDKWFNLRVEMHPDTHEDTRVKIFVDDKLVAVTDNYYGRNNLNPEGKPRTDISYTRIYTLISSDITMYLDNLHLYNTALPFKPSDATDLAYNVDLENDPKEYGFDADATVPAELNATGNAALAPDGEGKLLILGQGSIALAANQVNKAANCFTFDAKLNANAMAVGDTLEILMNESYRNTAPVKLLLTCTEQGGKRVITMAEGKNNTPVAEFTMDAQTAGVLTVNYYDDVNTLVISLDGKQIATLVSSLQYAEIYNVDTLLLTYKGSGNLAIDDLSFDSTGESLAK